MDDEECRGEGRATTGEDTGEEEAKESPPACDKLDIVASDPPSTPITRGGSVKVDAEDEFSRAAARGEASATFSSSTAAWSSCMF
jgi:hypothetical protein